MPPPSRRRKSPPEDLWDEEEGGEAGKPAGGRNRRPSPEETGWGAPSPLTLLLCAVLALLLLALTHLKDESVPWEADLQVEVTPGPEPDMTAYRRVLIMLGAASRVDLSRLPPTPPWLWDTPTLSVLLDEHSAVLDNFRDLLEDKAEEWQPRSLSWKKLDYGADPAWRAVLVMKQVEAAYLARRGQEEAAFVAATDLAALASLLEHLSAWPSFMERAFEFHDAAARFLAEQLRNTRLGPERLRRLQEEEYAPFAPSPERLREAMKGYYAYERKLLLGAPPDEPPLPPGYVPARTGWVFFKPHATLRLFADSFRELKAAPVYTSYARGSQLSSRLDHRPGPQRKFFNPNWSGQEYHASRIRFYAALPDRQRLSLFRHQAVITLFAVRRYVMTEARLPGTLEDLAPGYLPEVYLDPFTGEPLRYDPERGLIYSVGEDYKDDGGKPGEIPLGDPAEPTLLIGIGVARPGGR